MAQATRSLSKECSQKESSQKERTRFAKTKASNKKEGEFITTVPTHWIVDGVKKVYTDEEGVEREVETSVFYWPPKNVRSQASKDVLFEMEPSWPSSDVLKIYCIGAQDYCRKYDGTSSNDEGSYAMF